MRTFFGILVAALTISACSDPCHDYCDDIVKKAQQCGLGGPSGDSAVNQCSDELNKEFTHDACSNADDSVKNMSCDDFKSVVCSTDVSASYSCQ